MAKILNVDKSLFIFAGAVLALIMAFGSIAFSFNAKQEARKQAVEAEQLKTVMFFTQKNDLEECMNASTDKAIKTESFDLLLQHTISQDVPVTTMSNMIQKCRTALQKQMA